MNPVGPAAQPEKFAIALSNTTPVIRRDGGSSEFDGEFVFDGELCGSWACEYLVDFSGDTTLVTVEYWHQSLLPATGCGR